MLWWTLRQLRSKDRMTRRRAAQKLIRSGNARAVGPLVHALEDDDSDVQVAAAEALGRIGDKQAVEPLATALKDDWDRVIAAAAEALGRIGDARAVEPLARVLKDRRRYDYVRRIAVEAMGKIKDMSAKEPLLAVLKDNDKELRKAAVDALKAIGWQPTDDNQRVLFAIAQKRWDEAGSLGLVAVKPLINALKSADSLDRKGAARALGEIGSSQAVGPLVTALEDGDYFVREAAANALGRLGEAAIQPLVGALKSGRRNVREQAMDLLNLLGWHPADDVQRAILAVVEGQWDEAVRLRDASVESLIVTLKDEEISRRRAAAEALGRIGDARAAEPLVAAFKDDEVRDAAAKALSKIGSAAVEPLVGALDDARFKEGNFTWEGVAKVQEAVAGALVKIGNAAVEPLIAALKDDRRQEKAAKVLGEIGDVRAVEALIAVLKEGYSVRRAAVEALGKIGDRRAVEPLSALVKDRDEKAVEVLGKIKDARAIAPLIEYAKYDEGRAETEPKAQTAIWALREVLEAAAKDASTDDLREAAGLENLARLRSSDWCAGRDNPYEVTIDCAQIRQLARQELIRRGLEA